MIVRGKRPDRYTVLSNDIIRNHALSFKARGLLAYLLSMPDNWSVSSAHLAKTGPDGREAVRTALIELVSAGYLIRERKQDPSTGRWGWIQTVYDAPVGNRGENDGTDVRLSDDGKPHLLITTHKEVPREEIERHTQEVPRSLCKTCNGAGWLVLNLEDVERCPQCNGDGTQRIPA